MSPTEPPPGETGHEEVADRLESPHPNGSIDTAGSTRRRRTKRRLILAGAIVFIAVWIFAIIWSVTITTRSPERLDDPAATAVQQACTTAQTRLRALPPVPQSQSLPDRVARIRTENDAFEAMTAALTTVHPSRATPATALEKWTADWRRMITARARFAADLAHQGRAEFVIPATGGVKPITDKMDDFVREQHHRIDSCFTDGLQLEVVVGKRTYQHVEG
jgi:hypothetical protein